MTTMPDADLRRMVRRNAANWQPEWAAAAAVGAITAWADDAPEFTERQRLLAIRELLAVYRGVAETDPDGVLAEFDRNRAR